MRAYCARWRRKAFSVHTRYQNSSSDAVSQAHYDWVSRALYGTASPSGQWRDICRAPDTKPVMTLVAEIIGVQTLSVGEKG